MQTETRVTTTSGEVYLKKLCRHFAHKVPATLILPLNSFRGPREVELVNPTLGRLKLTALMLRGMDFDRVLFEPLA